MASYKGLRSLVIAPGGGILCRPHRAATQLVGFGFIVRTDCPHDKNKTATETTIAKGQC